MDSAEEVPGSPVAVEVGPAAEAASAAAEAVSAAAGRAEEDPPEDFSVHIFYFSVKKVNIIF